MQAVMVLAVAHAETPSPARRCAESAAGTEVEVCLRLAAENPDAVEEIASALIAHLDRAEAPDRSLLDALLLLSTARGAEGARWLGALDDPRVVPVLLHVASTAEPEVAVAAIGALVTHPEVIPTLEQWLVERDRPLAVRLAIAGTLGRYGLPEADDALHDALRRTRRIPPPLRAEIVRLLSVSGDDLPPTTSGAPWVAFASSTGFAYAMGTAGHFGRIELWQVGAATGGVAGASIGWLYGSAWPMEAGDAALIATLGAGGTVSGMLIGAGLRAERDRSADLPLLGGLAGELTGYGLGIGLKDLHHGTVGDSLEAAAFATIVGAAADSSAAFVAHAGIGNPPRAAVAGVGVALGLTVGQIAAPYVDPVPSAGLVASGASLGLATGLLLPLGDAQRGSLPIATTIGGAAAGTLASAWARIPRDVLVAGATGGVFGAGVGGGIGLLAAPETPDVARTFALSGLAVGYGVGAVVARIDPDPIDDRDVAVSAAITSWAAWDLVAISHLADLPDAQRDGAVLLAASVAGGGSTIFNLALDIPVPHTLSASSIGLWGGYAGAALAELTDADPYALALPLSNIGWIGGAVMVSPLVGTPPLVIGIADAGGVVGASFGAIGAGLATEDADVVVTASLGGAVVGLAVGAIVGTGWHRSGTRRDIALRLPSFEGRISLSPLAVRGGSGCVVSVVGW